MKPSEKKRKSEISVSFSQCQCSSASVGPEKAAVSLQRERVYVQGCAAVHTGTWLM